MTSGTVLTPNQRVDFASAGPESVGGQLLRQYWQPVHVARNLKPGMMLPILVMGEQFTLYRGEAGAAHVVGFRCAHRNTQLSPGWVRGDAVQCFYHGWTFDGDGRCVARPGELDPGPCAHVRIPAYPTREHLGVIYAYFGEGEPPAFPPFPSFEREGIIENLSMEFPCNWFQTYENQFDEVHAAFVHSRGESHKELMQERALPETLVTETDYGWERKTWSGDGPVRICLYPFPNHMRMIMGQIKGLKASDGWRDAYLTLVPTDDANHILYITTHVGVTGDEAKQYQLSQREFGMKLAQLPPVQTLAKEVLAGQRTMDDPVILNHPLIPVIEDAVAQLGQGPIHDRSKEILGRTDSGVAVLRRVYARELTRLEDGQALKEWHYNGEAQPSRGF